MNQTSATVGKAPRGAADYTCGVCGEPVEGDLLSFLRHTERHILDALRELHPEGVEGGEEGSKLMDIYRAQLGHDPWLRRESH